LKTHILAFIDALRGAGIDIAVAQTLDAMEAMGVLGLEREVLREGLAATLVKDESDRLTFDNVFDRFFPLHRSDPLKRKSPGTAQTGVGRGMRQQGGNPTAEIRGVSPPEDPTAALVASRRMEPRHREDGHRERLVHTRTLRRTPFHDLPARDLEACDALVADLARRFRAHLSRRARRVRRRRLDIRRTLRRAIATGGVPIDPVYRERRPGRPDLVALCDYSHSVTVASHFLCGLIAPAHMFFRRVQLFAFVDRAVEMSFEAGTLVPDAHIDLYARSDFGRVLVDFWTRHEAVLTRNTILLILGDARNNRRPPRPEVLARMHQRVQSVTWLNPDPKPRWNTGDSVIRTYERYCDEVCAAANIDDLARALKVALHRHG